MKVAQHLSAGLAFENRCPSHRDARLRMLADPSEITGPNVTMFYRPWRDGRIFETRNPALKCGATIFVSPAGTRSHSSIHSQH